MGHNPKSYKFWLPPYSLITKKVVAATDLFILRNKSAMGFARSIGVPNKKIQVIYKGIDLKKFSPVKKISSQKVNILYIGKNIISKGVGDLQKAYQKLINDGLKVNLKIVSNAPYSNLPEIYRWADICCSPSREIRFLGIKIWEEYFSYTLMEAQASGLPIVTTKSLGVIEEVDPRNEIVEKGDTDALYKSLKKLVLSKSLRLKLGKINRVRAEKFFDAKIQAKETEAAILKIC